MRHRRNKTLFERGLAPLKRAHYSRAAFFDPELIGMRENERAERSNKAQLRM